VNDRDRPTITVSVESAHDTFDYHFDNQSSFNTASLVPHHFDQHYDVRSAWLSGQARYRFAGRTWETDAAITPSVASIADDYDTFFNPDGNVIVYGTTANTTVRSLRAAQTVELGSGRGLRFRVGYAYRRDRSIFHDSESTTVQTSPPSQTAFWNTNRETTISELHQVRIGATAQRTFGRAWELQVVADASPATLARLTTLLPDKYPNDPVVFVAKAFAVDVTTRFDYCRGRVCAGAHASFNGAWKYASDASFHRQAWAVGAHATYRR
jgi:hypothetical protein